MVAVLTSLSMLSALLGLREQQGFALRFDITRSWRGWLERAWVPAPLVRIWRSRWSEWRLQHAGVQLSTSAFFGLRWLTILGSVCLAILMTTLAEVSLLTIFVSSLLLGAGWFGWQIWVDSRIRERASSVEKDFPDFLDRLTLAVEAGLGFEVALRRAAADYPGILGEEFRRMIRMLDRGCRRADVLDELANRNPSSALKAFAATVKQADHFGTSLAKHLRVQGTLIRNARRRAAQEMGRRLPILIVFPLVLFFLPALFILFLAPPLLHIFLP